MGVYRTRGIQFTWCVIFYTFKYLTMNMGYLLEEDDLAKRKIKKLNNLQLVYSPNLQIYLSLFISLLLLFIILNVVGAIIFKSVKMSPMQYAAIFPYCMLICFNKISLKCAIMTIFR